MAVDPDTLNDPKLIRQLMKNAAAAGMDDLVLKCHIRVADLAGQEYEEGLERDFWKATTAAEEIASQKNGKTTRLSPTKLKMSRVGIVKCVTDLAAEPKAARGFDILVQGGYPEYTADSVVVRHADKFPPDAVASAERKLSARPAEPRESAEAASASSE